MPRSDEVPPVKDPEEGRGEFEDIYIVAFQNVLFAGTGLHEHRFDGLFIPSYHFLHYFQRRGINRKVKREAGPAIWVWFRSAHLICKNRIIRKRTLTRSNSRAGSLRSFALLMIAPSSRFQSTSFFYPMKLSFFLKFIDILPEISVRHSALLPETARLLLPMITAGDVPKVLFCC